MKLCLACFKKCEDNVQSCPHCGYGSVSFTQPTAALPVGTLLQGRYMTGKAETKSNGIVYSAYDKQTKTPLELVEYYPDGNVSARRGNVIVYKDSEAAAKDVAKLKSNPKSIGFAENNTFYIAADTPAATVTKKESAPKKESSPKKKSARSKANTVFRYIAYTSSFICLIISAVYLLDYFVLDMRNYRKNAAEIQDMLQNTVATKPGIDPLEEIRKKYPGVDFPDGMNPNFAELYSKNSEFAGQVTIDGLFSEEIPFDFAVMQTKNNDKYLTVDLMGEKTKYGQPYFDYRNSIKTLDRNTIIHGHNMRSDDHVFGGLEQYRDPETFKKHPTIELKTLYGEYTFKIYAVIIVNSNTQHDNGKRFYYNFTKATDVEFAKYLEELDKRKLYSTGVDITKYDKIITLSTCCYDFDDARLAVIGRLVREGEDAAVDTSLVTANKNPKYPQIYYDVSKKTNPYKNDEHLFMVP